VIQAQGLFYPARPPVTRGSSEIVKENRRASGVALSATPKADLMWVRQKRPRGCEGGPVLAENSQRPGRRVALRGHLELHSYTGGRGGCGGVVQQHLREVPIEPPRIRAEHRAPLGPRDRARQLPAAQAADLKDTPAIAAARPRLRAVRQDHLKRHGPVSSAGRLTVCRRA
jgi:hypothetical protein